jgi:hypothetical protein
METKACASRVKNQPLLLLDSGGTMAENQKIARRSFFAGLGLIAAAGAAAKLAPSPSSTPSHPDSATQTEPEGTGYRLSEHVKKYYRTTTL